MSREWGIYPDGHKPLQWWGARAIIERGEMVLLPDRQNYERDESVSDVDKEDMFFWMSHEMDAALKKATKAGQFRESELFMVESESGRFHCEANGRSSGGYIYIGCWEV